MRMKLIGSLLVSISCLCCVTNLAAKSDAVNNGYYTAKDKEFYLTSEQLVYIRPGLVIEILDVAIPADMRLEVTYSIKDPTGLALDHDGIAAPGPTDMRFTLANIPMGEEQKVTLASERIDRGNGTLTSVGDGVYKYKFETVIASDQNTTHTLALGGRRDLREFGLDRYSDNVLKSWVPTGMHAAVARDIVTGETCNRCHDPLNMHGRWQSPNACTQCHNPGLVVDGTNLSLDTLIHQLHSGGNLETPLVVGSHDYSKLEYPVFPSPGMKECEVCHTGGTPTDNFPLVANPSQALVCDQSRLGTTELSWDYPGVMEIHVNSADGPLFGRVTGAGSKETSKWIKDGLVFFAVDVETGKTIQKLSVNTTVRGCVGNSPGTFRGKAAAQHTNWMDHVSRRVCGSCHDNVDFATGENHSEYEIIQKDDSQCAKQCHEADAGGEYDVSVKGSHIPFYKSAQLKGVLIELLGVTDTNPGDYPTVTFSIGSKNGPLDPTAIDRLDWYFAGPNEDILDTTRDSSAGPASVKAGDNWTFTSSEPIPMDAKGSFMVSVGGREVVDIDTGFSGIVEGERDNAENPLLAFSVDGSPVMPRRMVVDDYKCENCHSNFNMHGGSRHDPGLCAFCHNPGATAADETNGGEVSIHFKYMIHSIHRGAALTKPYSVGSHDYAWRNEDGEIEGIEYPGDLRNCEACHAGNSYQVPEPPEADTLLPTATPQALWDPMLPVTAACLSCHDRDEAAFHADSNTSTSGEFCATCHGEGKEYAVDKVHAH